jgi:multidrug resistance efflux pump
MQELDAAVADNRRKSSELEKLQSDLVREKRLVDHATDQRKHLELTITNLQRDKSELEATQQELSDKITELLRYAVVNMFFSF